MKCPRLYVLAALVLVAIGSFRIASTWRVFNHTIDEPDNLAAGMEYLSTGKYRYEDTHPPLARVFAAVGPYLAGERFSIADAYAYVILNWARRFELDLSSLPKLEAYFERVRARPAVQHALREEGLPAASTPV